MHESIQKWIDSNYKNYLKKNPPLEPHIYDHIMDWMKSPEAASYLPRLDRVAVPTAIDLSNKWTVFLNKKNEKNLKKIQDLSGVELIYKFSNDYSVVKLQSDDSFKREGVLMGHCVGSYSSRDDVQIYSLRDQNNEPHCTIEFNPYTKSIDQIKGKANLEVVPKYHKYVAEFLNQFHFESAYSYDLKNIASIYFGNYIFLNNEIPKVLEINKSLNIEKTNFIHSFDKLTVNGTTTLSKNRRCQKLAKELIINGDLIIEEFHGLLKIADKLIVKGSIEITDCENLKLLASEIEAESICIVDCNRFTQKITNIETDIIQEKVA